MPRTIINIASIVFVLTLVAAAQESRSEIGVQGIGLFTQNSNGYSVARSATETGGILASYRYHINRWLSARGCLRLWTKHAKVFHELRGVRAASQPESSHRRNRRKPSGSGKVEAESLPPGGGRRIDI